MLRYISKTPMVSVIPSGSQKERLDTLFYHHFFADLDQRLEGASDEIVPAEKASLLITDGTHQTPTYTEKENGILFLSSTNIAEHGVDLSECKYITADLHKRLKNCQPQPGDVLIAKSGTVGTACVFPEGFPECSVYESVAIFRPNVEWNPNYIAAFINSDLGIRQIQRSQKGIAIKHLHLGDLKELWFPKIGKDEQKNLVSRIEFVLNLHKRLITDCNKLLQKEHALTRRKIDLAYAKELRIDNFVESRNQLCFLRDSNLAERFDVPANHPDYTKLVDQIKNSETAGTLLDLADITEDRFNPEEHLGIEINYLAIGDIDGVSGEIIAPQTLQAEDLPSRARRSIQEGTILVGIAGASTGTENMVVFPVTDKQNGWVATTGFLALRPKKDVEIRYLCNLVKAPFVLRQIRALLTSPSMPTINEMDFLAISVPVTDFASRERTTQIVKAAIYEEQQLAKKLKKISEEIDSLLSNTKSNIFDLLANTKFESVSAQANEIKSAMSKIEESLLQ